MGNSPVLRAFYRKYLYSGKYVKYRKYALGSGKDVAEALGYSDTDQILRRHVDDDDKLTRSFDGFMQEALPVRGAAG